MEYPAEYGGMTLNWRGWIGLHGKTVATMRIPGGCFKCGRPIETGDVVSLIFNRDEDSHWVCLMGSADVPETLVAQWIAGKLSAGEHKSNELAYATYPGGEGFIQQGGLFDIEKRDGQSVITEDSSEEEKENAKADAYRRLTEIIDAHQAVPA